MTIVALDVDLHKIYAVTDGGKILAKAEPNPEQVISSIMHIADGDDEGTTVLIEVASPVMYIKDIKVVHNVVKWALWNITAAQRISSALLRDSGTRSYDVFVAPSHVWTHGHALDVRHQVAKCVQKQKDLRECEAMIFYYKQDPSKWVPLSKYLEDL